MKTQIKEQQAPGVRMDRRTGQYIPTMNGKDLSPTSFSEERAMEIARQQLANARLIAAAPELLRIVIVFEDHANAGNIIAGHNGMFRETITQLVREARAAIAKATGT